MSHYDNHLKNIKQKIDDISPSFCAAKWKQVTIHLQNGHTHSCHHPNTHLIPIEEIKTNPTALHNTTFKKMQRKMMLEGVRPSECEYCWKVEDGTNNYSDRLYKSANTWAFPFINDIASKPWDDNVDPSYVEVSFGNVCNFKCSYCAPHISSQWMEEVERFGPYPTIDNFNNLDWIKHQKKMPIPNKDENPYVDAFWEWWPTMYTKLQHFRITGGEPLLNKNTFKVLDYIIENPNTNLEVSINTNMNPPDEIFELFMEKVKIITSQKKLKDFHLYTSAEAYGKQAEYIRFGMDYDKWLFNLHRIYKEIPGIHCSIMSTYNLLSIHSYDKFLADILEIKRIYGNIRQNKPAISLDIPYLRHPEHQTVFLADESMIPYIEHQIQYMVDNLEKINPDGSYEKGFYVHEVDKLKRIYELMVNAISVKDEMTDVHRMDFVKFFDEHDRRRGTNLLETFPEMKDFYNFCKLLIENDDN